QAYELWQEIGILGWNNFLDALETKAQAPGFAERALFCLQKIIVEKSEMALPIKLGPFYAANIEITKPLVNVTPPPGTTRFLGMLTVEGDSLGMIELPVCDGLVSAWVLTDAIATRFYWQILERFFQHTLYSKAPYSKQPNAQHRSTVAHNHEEWGWTAFLRELWGYPQWLVADFYKTRKRDGKSPQKQADNGWITIEVSAPLPQITVQSSRLHIIPTVGGIAIGVISIPVKNNYISSQALRVAITTDGNVELCRACVREALIGRSLMDPTSLRARLALAAQTPASAFINDMTLPQTTLTLGQRFAPLGASTSRRAMLPSSTVETLLELATITHEPAISKADSSQVTQVVYAPELIDQSRFKLTPSEDPFKQQQVIRTNLNDRTYFEQLFASQPNPWKYTSEYEQVKYEQTLSLLPETPIQQALELACAEGHFTAQLAPRVQNLVAADISQIALDHTAQRCAHFDHIRYQQIDIAKDPIPGTYNLIICSEVLYYMGNKAELRAVAKKCPERWNQMVICSWPMPMQWSMNPISLVQLERSLRC
ncbi:MAG: methyltransferase domain-containing protein, partial [Phormidesmis sp. RL_2_1]|nr:methyltransferase domain-containing protein [Phormidesmis sp. RL_2_1]